MKKYHLLINILDNIRNEAPSDYKRYSPPVTNKEKLQKARSLAFIHLFLKVKFGMMDFLERHQNITDDSQDGGIDAFYIDEENKKLFLIQAKFSPTENNFENKSIHSDDILKMEVARITQGEEQDTNSVDYNGKIKRFQKKLAEIRDIAKYVYEVIFLGNITRYNDAQIRKLIDNCEYEIYNYHRAYNELVFPLCTGTFYDPDEITIKIDLLDKEHPKLKQKIETDFGNYNVTVIFVPTIEIGRILSKYKNAILKYNPRNFLSLKTNSVNIKIRDSILDHKKNNFAILNNGITMLSDNVQISESTGEKNAGQLILTRPQILNGGQTAFTLSSIYDSHRSSQENPLNSKEVLLKVVTPMSNGSGIDNNFIQMISNSTNQQSEVKEADRRSNHNIQIEIQKLIYNEYGYFYERKSGEFLEGIQKGFIEKSRVIDRLDLIKAYYAFKGFPAAARRTSEKILFKYDKFIELLGEHEKHNEMFFAFMIFKNLVNKEEQFKPKQNSIKEYGYSIMYGKWAVIASIGFQNLKIPVSYNELITLMNDHLSDKLSQWKEFDKYVSEKEENNKYFSIDNPNYELYYKVNNLDNDVKEFFLK